MNTNKEVSMCLTLEGITAILMHRYTVGMSSGNIEEELPPISGPLGKRDYSDEWLKTILSSNFESELDLLNRTVIMPDYYLQACFREAGKKIKIKGNLTAKSIMVTGFRMDNVEYPILYNGGNKLTVKDVYEKGWLHEAGVTIGTSKVDRTRSYIPTPWSIKVTADVNIKDLPINLLESVVNIAGREKGLGDWRPGAKTPGSYGQFRLKSCDIIEG